MQREDLIDPCHFDYTAVAGNGKVGRLTTPVEWMLSVVIRLTVLSRYRNRRIIGHFNFQKRSDKTGMVFFHSLVTQFYHLKILSIF